MSCDLPQCQSCKFVSALHWDSTAGFFFPPLDFTGMNHWTSTVRLEKLLLKMKMLLSFCTFVQSSIIFHDNLRRQNDWMNDLELNPPSNRFTSLSEMELVILTDVLHVSQTEEMYFFFWRRKQQQIELNWIWSSDLKRKKKKNPSSHLGGHNHLLSLPPLPAPPRSRGGTMLEW